MLGRCSSTAACLTFKKSAQNKRLPLNSYTRITHQQKKYTLLVTDLVFVLFLSVASGLRRAYLPPFWRTMPQPTEEFVSSYTGCQSQLFAFLLSLLGSPQQAEEVLQEANLVIWRKSDQFIPGTSFIAWAISIARYQAMAYREKQGRDRLRFDERATEAIANAYAERNPWPSDRLTVLDQCIGALPEPARSVLMMRYKDGLSPASIAAQQGKTYRAIVQSLSRVRAALAECIRSKEAGDA